MEPADNRKAWEKPARATIDTHMGYRNVTAHLLLYLFIALEWITAPVKNRENSYTTGIGLS